MEELDRQKIGGFWREVGVASDQNLVLTAQKRVEGLFLTLSGSNLTVKVAYNSSGSCEIEKIVGSEIDSTGKFAFPAAALPGTARPAPLCPTARSLEDEDWLGFWKFRELTADTGLYLAARPGRCAELLKEAGPVTPFCRLRRRSGSRVLCAKPGGEDRRPCRVALIAAPWGLRRPRGPEPLHFCVSGADLMEFRGASGDHAGLSPCTSVSQELI
ncbi:epididymal-specific lipocalin-8 isoform X5 [Pan paniscus]|uniref:epididymal-specific lipocalin-8 isoform X5 n=1 Tax=Pan paniscus TaxID=9597 RepID=UPI00156181B2|nr:epididymal-specific lipocalin-8 isoform X3 [Pan paniscus]